MKKRLLILPEDLQSEFSRDIHIRTLREFGYPVDLTQHQPSTNAPPCTTISAASIPTSDTTPEPNPDPNPEVINKYAHSHTAPHSLTEVVDYYKSKGIVGEERNCILQTLCAIIGQPFGIEGGSGSGKSYLADALIGLLPRKSVYTLELSTENALFYDAESINKARFLYIPELQKAMGRRHMNIIEAIKNITEGKSINRITARSNGKVYDHVIEGEITVFYTLARENDFKKDTETARRFLQLQADESPEQVRRILEYKTRQRAGVRSESMPAHSRRALEAHVADLIRDPIETIDVYAGIVLDQVPLLNKSKGFINHYLRLVDASASFHRNDRMRMGDGKVMVDIADHRLIYDLYFPTFLRCVYELEGKAAPELPAIDWDTAEQETLRAHVLNTNPSWPTGRTSPRVYDCAQLLSQSGVDEVKG